MVVFPNCKINIGLHIIRKRQDGYHDLETIFYPVAVTDLLEFVESPSFSFQQSGLPVYGDPSRNLCVKAYNLLTSQFPLLPPLQLYLHKAIPMGAGLGGGSADAAFLITSLNRYFSLGLSQQKMVELSLKLGSDCPFFISNTTCFGSGRGDILEPVDLPLAGHHIILVYPGITVSTAQAFAGIEARIPEYSLRSKINEPIDTWKDWMVNDFESTVFRQYPEIREIKETLYNAGALYASMSGSGSACYGLYRSRVDIAFPSNYTVFSVALK